VTTKKSPPNLPQMPRPSRPLSRRRRALRVAAVIICAGRDATGDCLASRRSAEYGDNPDIAGAQGVPATFTFSGSAATVGNEGEGPSLLFEYRPMGGLG
jgi:hypothetical protein